MQWWMQMHGKGEARRMKPQLDKKYTTIAIYTAIVLVLGVLSVFFFLKFGEIGTFLSNLLNICAPIFYGAFIAYILNPLMRLFEEKVLREKNGKGMSRRARRILSVTLTMFVFFAVIALLVWMLYPQLRASVINLGERFPEYLSSLQALAASIVQKGGPFSDVMTTVLDRANDFIESSYELLSEYLPRIPSALKSVAATFLDIVLGVVFAVYFLGSKERVLSQVKKIARALFSEKLYRSIGDMLTLADKTFSRYFTGAFLDSILVGILCFVMMTILGMPYAPLISTVIGVTNIIPIFGPFLGAIPSAVILFVYRPILAVYFGLMILVLQQIDGNVIAPRIHGASTGLAPVWVIVSITVMSGLFGFIGMFIGVPIFSVLYAIVKRRIELRLGDKGAPVESVDYMSESGKRLYAPVPSDTRTMRQKLRDFGLNIVKCGKWIAAGTKKLGAFLLRPFQRKVK